MNKPLGGFREQVFLSFSRKKARFIFVFLIFLIVKFFDFLGGFFKFFPRKTPIISLKIYCELDERIEYETVPEVFYDTEESYDNVENLISAMNLSAVEEETLRLLYNGVRAYNVAEQLDLCFQTVYLRRKKIQNRYFDSKKHHQSFKP